MYYPGMQAAILQESAKCSLCASYGSALPKEPMLSHEIPQGPWKFISQDLFNRGGRWYSVTVDHYSDWFEVDLLNDDITAANVISVTKAHFARYGIPDTFLLDNEPQYTFQEFSNFAKTYGLDWASWRTVITCLRRSVLVMPVKPIFNVCKEKR